MLNEAQIAQKASEETIVSVHRWNERLLTFTTTRPANYSFAAGQYARLGLRGENDVVWRAYSMTSAPAQDHLEFYGILVPGGLFTLRLKSIQPGDRIFIEKQCYGFMTPDRFSDGSDLWMMATGTGIGPYLSMLRDPYVWQKFERLILVHGVRDAREFTYSDELEQLQLHPPVASHGTLQVIRATSRESTPAYLHGRITALLENGELEKAIGRALTEAESRIMMCGNPDMIEDMRRLLHQRGMRPVRRALPGQFVTENYW